ncbi:alpha/beta hydrolase [Oleiagrimonas sp. C23AA]|uniref:alpha/beta fold hydrolase n=1 Tax=Oleiagrimonas sp. C23AA TaxID=2719047 RepID=UPI0014208753|nr:alpha/beta hydrolase [Oleiagrimonas sp. C23AA]NII10796.1 alpha/beta hydrolase [Oleiagrimonas sp. C23AA]
MSDASSLATFCADDGHRLHVADRGEAHATPLLLIHGSLCDARYWRPQMAPLAERGRVLAPSLRHCWPEPWDGEGAGYSIAQHASDMAALIDALGGEPVHVLGHSRGARVALELARTRPDAVRSLMLADPGLVAPATDKAADGRQRAMRLIGQGDTEAGLELFIDTVSGRGTWQHMVPWFKTMVRDNAHTLIAQATESVPQLDDAALAELAMPTLLLGGDHSPAPFPAALDRLQQAMPDTCHVRIPHASHGMNLANPRAFNAAVNAFIERIETPA